jgi:CRP-like cAMP-binding protein
MSVTALLNKINAFAHLTDEEQKELEAILIPRPFKQGEILVKSGDTARYMMFVNSGYLMTYFTDREGNEHVMQFARDEWWSGDVYSLSSDPVTIYTTKALSDGEVLLLPKSGHEQLMERYSKFEKYFRIFFQASVIRQQLRLIESYTADAEQRYQTFVATFPGMEQYVPQKYIASYLGITPEFLSKVRKRLSGKSRAFQEDKEATTSSQADVCSK